MKRCYVLLLICMVTSVSLQAQTTADTGVRHVLEKQVKAWNSGNIDAFMETYWKNDSLLFIGASGPSYGWKTTLEHYKKRYPDTTAMGKLDFQILEVKMLSTQNSFVVGKWHLSRSAGDIGGYFTLLLKKINGQWYIVVDHTS